MDKKTILISIILLFFITACKLNNNNISNNKDDNVEDDEISSNIKLEEMIDMSFEDRIREANEYKEIPDKFGLNKLGYGFVSHFIEGATLSKKEDYYLMQLYFSSPFLYDSAEVNNAVNQAKNNGKSEYNGFMFYNSVEELKNIINWNEETPFPFENTNEIVSIYGENQICLFVPTPNDNSKYIVVFWNGDDSLKYLQLGFDKEIDVVLLPKDIITIVQDGMNDGVEITVEDYYKKSQNNEAISFNDSAVYYYNINNIGYGRDRFGKYKNAIDFKDNKIIANYVYNPNI